MLPAYSRLVFMDKEFNKFALKNGVTCNYTPFNFIAKDDEKIVGIITGHSYYNEVHIGDLIELEENKFVIPGFIDQHIHGAAGSDAMDGTVEFKKSGESLDIRRI